MAKVAIRLKTIYIFTHSVDSISGLKSVTMGFYSVTCDASDVLSQYDIINLIEIIAAEKKD